MSLSLSHWLNKCFDIWHTVPGLSWEANPVKKYVVKTNRHYLTVRQPGGEESTLAWREVRKIEVVTVEKNEKYRDGWIVITSDQVSCSFPQGATGENELLDSLFELEGFNQDAFLNAIGCNTNNVFLCWSAHH